MINAACHIHSDWSYDGKWTLPALSAEFGRRGYRVVMMTEHDRGFTEARRQDHRAACSAASSADVLVVPGIEYSDRANIVHMLVWGPVPFIGEGVPTTELLKAVRAANGVAVLAHPSRRRMWQVFDPSWAHDLLGIEVWNRKTDGWSPAKTALPLLQSSSAVPFVGIDFHDHRQFISLAMQLDVAGGVSELSVLECLRARRCRALAFDRPLPEIMRGFPGMTLNAAELARRSAAKVYRTLKPRKAVGH